MLVVENQHDTKDCPYELLFYPLKMLLTGGAVEFSIRVLNGEPKDIGTFTITVKMPDGTSKEIIIKIEPLRKVLSDMISMSETRTRWLVILSGSKERPTIELSFPVYVPYDPQRQAGHRQGASVEASGGSMSAAPLKNSGRAGSSRTEMFVKVTGTVESRDAFEVKTVRYRIGAVEYEQSTSVKLSDMNVTDRSTSGGTSQTGSGGGGCNAGFAGFASVILALAALKRKR